MHRKQLHKNTTNVPAKLNAISQRGNGAIWQYFIPSFLRLKHIQMGTNMWFHFFVFFAMVSRRGFWDGPKRVAWWIGGTICRSFWKKWIYIYVPLPQQKSFSYGMMKPFGVHKFWLLPSKIVRSSLVADFEMCVVSILCSAYPRPQTWGLSENGVPRHPQIHWSIMFPITHALWRVEVPHWSWYRTNRVSIKKFQP